MSETSTSPCIPCAVVAPSSHWAGLALSMLLAATATGASAQVNFGRASPSAATRNVADWVAQSNDHGQSSFVIIDKRAATMYVFDARARLKGSSPILLGAASGDDTVPGIGDRPLAQVLPHEKTTPAGRFVAEHGRNTNGEDIVWVDYEAAVSMHRVRASVPSERRLQRLASGTAGDNRISFGCINVPRAFYETQLSPAIADKQSIVYILPEQKSLKETFGPGVAEVSPVDRKSATKAAAARSG